MFLEDQQGINSIIRSNSIGSFDLSNTWMWITLIVLFKMEDKEILISKL